jgi:hypothetical protein
VDQVSSHFLHGIFNVIKGAASLRRSYRRSGLYPEFCTAAAAMVRVWAHIKISAIQASSSAYQASGADLLPQFSPPPRDADTMPRTSLVSSVGRRLKLALAALPMMRGVDASQNATVCPTDQLDWYTSVVGESPCRTYERLRQICDEQCA